MVLRGFAVAATLTTVALVNQTSTLQSLSSLRPADTASLIAAAADVALLVDADGVIRDVSVASDELAGLGSADWVGRRWADTVTVESRAKVQALLDTPGATASPKWRHINHPSSPGADVPLMYSTIPTGTAGMVVAIGRDLRQIASIQQRLVAAQQSMERDYLRLRQMESRYRTLFHSISEAVLMVDSRSLKVVEANPAAARVLGEPIKRIVGRVVGDCFESVHRASVLSLLETVRGAPNSEGAPLRLVGGKLDLTVSASMFRQDGGSFYLVRCAPMVDEGSDAAAPTRRALFAALERAPDALVVTNTAGRILYANASFARMAQMESAEQVLGESLDRWLGRSGVDLGVLIANLRQNESVRLFPTVIRGRVGAETAVEISAASVPGGEHPCLGFTIRDIDRRLPAEGRRTHGMSRTVEQLTELVGRVPLKEIVGETSDLIEQLCIEAALQLTRDNRAAAAEMLGLSRQSLYVKLRRYGLGDHPAEGFQ
jgi:transcriptional regulator PpsR